jgi:DNA polymerase
MTVTQTIVPPSKPTRDHKILILGEAPGETEVQQLRPFCGRSGQLLDSCWQTSGLTSCDLYITNVFKIRPHDNNAKLFFTKTQQTNTWTKSHHGYIKDEFAHYIDDLKTEILDYNPKIIIGLGKVAHWALSNLNLDKSIEIKNFYHPAYILRSSRLRDEYIQGFEFLKSYRLDDNPNTQNTNQNNNSSETQI